MPKKKRYRSRSSGGGSGSGGGYSNSQGGRGGGGRRGGSRRRRNSGQNSEPFPEPQVDENGEIPLLEFTGILEMHPNGYGFLRSSESNYSRERSDPFVPGTMIEKFSLASGRLYQGHDATSSKATGSASPRDSGCRWHAARRVLQRQEF